MNEDEVGAIKSTVQAPPLRRLGDKHLLQTQPPVALSQLQTPEFRQKLTELTQAMKTYGGLSISAPQIGWSARVICFGIEGTNPHYPHSNDLPLTIWINPIITWKSKKSSKMWEGCLSIRGTRGWIERPSEVTISGWDESGVERKKRLKGLAARIAQHELDHLDGILFLQYVHDERFLVQCPRIAGD